MKLKVRDIQEILGRELASAITQQGSGYGSMVDDFQKRLLKPSISQRFFNITFNLSH
ncbi:hypothetical protein O5O45_18920 [Hahella aquimaris]|uniref:hypothetical protein n=1 Tax=Hahella sp. HNIBRBA332 TaxID=3015983 RepID=UPI00273B5060|nr:hypothetical protein [Hahella sp. HNIBRBA332]WLQ11803.1 hypothetical protein O5O45_18920 [Hahella sp. HNIBRBA332]